MVSVMMERIAWKDYMAVLREVELDLGHVFVLDLDEQEAVRRIAGAQWWLNVHLRKWWMAEYRMCFKKLKREKRKDVWGCHSDVINVQQRRGARRVAGAGRAG